MHTALCAKICATISLCEPLRDMSHVKASRAYEFFLRSAEPILRYGNREQACAMHVKTMVQFELLMLLARWPLGCCTLAP